MTDEEVARFHNGDAVLFDHLVLTLSPRLLRAALHLTRHRDAAEELVHDTWVLAFKSRRTFQKSGSILGWLLAIMKSADRGAWRSHDRASRTELAYMSANSTVESAFDDVVEKLDEADRRATLLEAVMDLPPRQRDVLLMRVFEERSVSDTAVALQMAEGTVKATLSQAIKRLRANLNDD